MPSDRAKVFTFEIHVEPKYVEKFKELLDEPDVGNVALACEHTIGQLLHSEIPRYTAGAIMRGGTEDYGVGVAEVYAEGQS